MISCLHKCLGAEDPENKTHLRQGISCTLLLRRKQVYKIESTSQKEKDLSWKTVVREIYPWYVLKEEEKDSNFWISEIFSRILSLCGSSPLEINISLQHFLTLALFLPCTN